MTTFTPERIPFLALPWKRFQDRKDLPYCAAIYFVCNGASKVLYIGRTRSLGRRWITHHRLRQCQKVPDCRIAWLVVDDPTLLDAIEAACIAYFQPPWNAGPQDPDDLRGLLVNMKVKPEGLRLLRLIAATTGEKQYAILDRLLTREWARVQPHVIAKESSHAS